jgi:putative oxidoreductase
MQYPTSLNEHFTWLNEHISSINSRLTSLYRIVFGLLIALHGVSTLFGVLGRSESVPADQWPGGFAADIQLVLGLLVLIGLKTRPAAVLLSGTMAYAYFSVHQKVSFLPMQNGGEPAALYSWGFLIIAVIGAGPWSLDAILSAARRRNVTVLDAADRSQVHQD